MVQAFFAVVYDLWCFVSGTDAASGTGLIVSSAASPATVNHAETATPEPVVAETVTVEYDPYSAPAAPAPLHEPTIMYIRVPHTNMHRVPRADFDTIILSLPYGAAVTAVAYEGNYTKVFKAEAEGWIIKDHLESAKELVWPQLHPGIEYLCDTQEVQKLRSCIGDEFSAAAIGLPLQAVEYVTLRLAQDNRYILWPHLRPREAGSWQWLLRGRRGVHIAVHPSTDTVMEWLGGDGFGRLGYVEAVHPDRSIVVSLVGLHTAGVYEVVTWSESFWRELRPVFIEVT